MAEATAAKAEIEKVKMQDGREVGFAGKRRMLKEVVIEGSRVGVRFDFRSGNVLMAWVPDVLALYSAGHGYAQKLGDNVAGLKNEDGSAASEDDMQLEIEGLHERLQKAVTADDWNAVREGGGFGGASVLMKALIEWSGQTADQVKEFLKGKTQVEKMALRDESNRKGKSGITIKEIVVRLEAEKKSKAAAVDTGALLAGLPVGA